MENATKRCSKCTKTKPADAFSPRGGRRRDRQAWCKPCASAEASQRARAIVRERRHIPTDTPGMQGYRDHRPFGSQITHKGYVITKTPGHHRADKYGWVYEHVLVAEKKYGIEVTREFTVHHINGDRADNRPENLDLRWGNHGKGADVLPALLRLPEMRAIAREVLAQYDT